MEKTVLAFIKYRPIWYLQKVTYHKYVVQYLCRKASCHKSKGNVNLSVTETFVKILEYYYKE